MWKKVLVIGATTTAIVGAGVGALAATGGSTPSPSPSPSAGSTHAGHHDRHGRGDFGRALHGSWVTKGADGTVTHDVIRGTVTAVSASSITVKAEDGVSETYAVTSTTVEHLKTDGKNPGKAGQISQVKTGDRAVVLGTGTGTPTATHVVDRGAPKATTTS